VTADRIADLGLGRVVSRTEVTEDELLEAVAATASDPVITQRVRWMSGQVALAGGEIRAADAVESWLGAKVEAK
jgi:UDP:flavonoid glycosyltransferase YjiC (YdhE family)